MESQKNALVSTPVLVLPNETGYLTINTDAYDLQVGCVLLRKQLDNTVESIGFWSRLLMDTERLYDTTQL